MQRNIGRDKRITELKGVLEMLPRSLQERLKLSDARRGRLPACFRTLLVLQTVQILRGQKLLVSRNLELDLS